jgi:hypothetical protein
MSASIKRAERLWNSAHVTASMRVSVLTSVKKRERNGRGDNMW